MFPKAQIKRFNEAVGCAPPPGAYDPKIKEKPSGGVVDKCDRFKDPKLKDGAANTSTISSTGNTPVKQLFAAPQPVKSARKPSKSTPSAETSKIKDLERELKNLFKEKKDKEHLVTQKEEELKKLDSKLHLTQTDKSALQARLAAAQKELLEIKKANSHLKSKDSSSDAAHKKLAEVQTEISTLKQQLNNKDGEIVRLKKDVDTVMTALIANLNIIETTTVALEESVKKHDKTFLTNSLKVESGDEFLTKLGNLKAVDAKIKMVKKRSQDLHGRFTEGLTRLSAVTVSVQGQYESVTRSLEQLEARLAQTTSELQAAIDTRKQLEEHRNELLASNDKLEGQVKHLSEEHKAALELNNTTAERIQELEKSKTTLEAQFNDLQKVRELVEKEHSEKLMAIKDKETVFYENTSKMHERMVELQAENEDFSAALQETGELLSKTKDENMALEEALIEVRSSWETEKREFLARTENLLFEKSKIEGDLIDTEKKVELLNNDLEEQKRSSEITISDLQVQLNREKTELLQLQNKLGDLVFEKSQLHTEIGHLEAQLKLVKSESDQVRTEADKAMMAVPILQDKIDNLNSAKDEADKKVEELKQENFSLQKTLEIFQSDLDSYSRTVEEDKQDAQDKIVRLTDEIEGLKEQKDQMAKELDDWLTDKSELDIEIAKLQCRIKVLEMDSNQQQEESEAALREQCDIVEKVTAEKKQMETDMEQYGIDLLSHAATIQSLQAQIQSKSNECDQVSKTVADLQNNLCKAEESKTDLWVKVTQLTDNYTSKCAECDELMEENEKLSEELTGQKEAYEDLECSLEQTRADFLKRCNERDGLKETNQVKDKSLAVLSQQVAELNQQLQDTNTTLQSKCTESTELLTRCGENEKSLALSVQQNANYKQQIEDYKEHLQLKCEECDDLRQRHDDLDVELTLSAKEVVDMQEKIESLQREKAAAEEKVSILDEYETEIQDLRQQVATSSGSQDMEAELNKYRTLYEELQAKVEPFMEQIDAFELEKQTLMGMNKNTQADLERLANDYAQLLGHQNHKQKIKLMVRMKDENYGLKKENMALKSEVAKHKRALQKIQEKETPSKFDPAKAFKHSRESLNVTQTKSPLKEVNRK